MSFASPAPVIYILEPFGGSARTQNPNLPHVFYDDLGITRGDGVFETLLVVDGRVANLDRHAERFRRSAKKLDLPAPDLRQWKDASRQAAEDWARACGDRLIDARLNWSYTRGRAGKGIPSAWLTAQAATVIPRKKRVEGIRVLSASRGYTLGTGAEAAPWRSDAAKTLDYADNMAALRWAKANGADDVIVTDPSDGRVLEATTASIIAVRPGGKLRTPTPTGGVLQGTSQLALFEAAEEQGWNCRTKDFDVDYLRRSKSVWLVSSVRRAMRVSHLDGKELKAPADELAEIAELIDGALERE